jgi:polyisoprenyl-phosphate glycosyltransferase
VTILLFFNGLMMINLGIIGEYLARIFTEVKARPIYLVRDEIRFEATQDQDPPL